MFAVRRLVRAGLLFSAVAAVSLTVSSSQAGGGFASPLGVRQVLAAPPPGNGPLCNGVRYNSQFGFGPGTSFRASSQGMGFFVVATFNGVEDVDTVQGIVQWQFDVGMTGTSGTYGTPFTGKLDGEMTMTVYWSGGGIGHFQSTCITEAETQGPHDPNGGFPCMVAVCERETEGEWEGLWSGAFPDSLDVNGEPVFVDYTENERPTLVNASSGIEGSQLNFQAAIEFGRTCNEDPNSNNMDDGFERVNFSTESAWGSAQIPTGVEDRGAFAQPTTGCGPIGPAVAPKHAVKHAAPHEHPTSPTTEP